MNNKYTDIVHIAWVERVIPKLKPYFYLMRLDRPIGTWLLLLPAWWSILMAGGISAWPTLILFAAGAVIMRGAGCVINDLWDRDLDAQVERTATRPLPAGDITSRQGSFFLILLLAIGFIILIQFNFLTIAIGIVSLILVGSYPLMKRITWWPQAFLGLTFNIGTLMGWAAVTGELGWQAWAFYIAGFFWTLGYDTIYALQDREDDAVIGIKSTARLFIEKWRGSITLPLYGFYCVHYFIIIAVVILGTAGSIHPLASLLFFTPLAHLIWQVRTLLIDDPHNALKRFKSNRDYGLVICVILLISQLLNQ